jgi:hypothetical protein
MALREHTQLTFVCVSDFAEELNESTLTDDLTTDPRSQTLDFKYIWGLDKWVSGKRWVYSWLAKGSKLAKRWYITRQNIQPTF